MRNIVAKKAAERDGHGLAPSRVPGTADHKRQPDVAPFPMSQPPGGGKYPHTVGLRIGHNLYATTENALDGAHRAGDYSFTSLPDVIRAALNAHFGGMALTAPPEMGGKRRTTIGLDLDLKNQYDELPNRKRGEIIERALRTFLNRGMVPGS